LFFFKKELFSGTLFDVWPGAIRFDTSRKFKHLQIKLQAGDVLIFRGDLVHGGAAVHEANVRIHAYMEVIGGCHRPKHSDGVEQTHFMCDQDHILKRKPK
jgi:ectoine hydroxylase-related dioxygenase (phytanoyl-CoA dioxygenase family)